MTDFYPLWVLLIAAAATLLTRALPFLIFNEKRGIPELIQYLGRILPTALIAILVIYCLKGLPDGDFADGLFQLISLGAVAALHFWKHNTIISIFGGTALYMLLIRLPL